MSLDNSVDASVKRGAPVEKVTTFVMGERAGVAEVLLLYHPSAGIQLPAGTVEPGESAVVAALREAEEETGIEGLVWGKMLGAEEVELAPEDGIMVITTPLYIRPDGVTHNHTTAALRRGIWVKVLRAEGDFLQVRYAESDHYPDAHYVTFEVLGWVLADAVTGVSIRHFARLTLPDSPIDFSSSSAPDFTQSSWTTNDDNNIFTLCWHRLDALPKLVPTQEPWLRYLSTP